MNASEPGHDPTIRMVVPKPLLRLPPRDGRAEPRFTVDAIGRPYLWCPERVDLGHYRSGVFRFLHFSGDTVTRLPIPESPALGPLLAPFSDGRLLVVSTRTWRDGPRENAAIYSFEGELLARFRTGDAVEDVQITRDGRIWISYFDEGREDHLTCFADDGRLLFTYDPFAHGRGLPWMEDCYALNVADDHDTWAYSYPDFPLIRLRDFEVSEQWSALGVPGARAFAVDGRRVLFAGRYREYGANGRGVSSSQLDKRLYLLTLATGEVEPLQPVYATVDRAPVALDFTGDKPIGRGSQLFLSDRHQLYVVDLAHLR